MRWDELASQECSISRSLSVIGDRWTLLIIRNSFVGLKRFDDILENLQVSRTILTDRLNKLVDHGVLKKEPYQTKPMRYDYKLTDKGHALYPIIMTISQWGETYYSEGRETTVVRTHRKCGHDFIGVMACSECGEALQARDIRTYTIPKEKHQPNSADKKVVA